MPGSEPGWTPRLHAAKLNLMRNALPRHGLYFAALLGGLLLVAGCRTTTTNPSSLQRFEFSQPQMGLPFRMVLYAPDSSSADAAAQAAFARIAELNGILSDYDTDSELSRLSRTAGEGRAIPLSPDLWLVLDRAQKIAAETDGAFDITVGPCVSLWRKARREKKLPRVDLLAETLKAVGWQKLKLDSKQRTATLLVPDMRLDLGSIAKGYAIDEALNVLRRYGIRSALVTGGGDMAAGDPPPDRSGWRITLAPLDVTNAPPARHVLLANAGLGTSGDLFQHVEIDGRRYSHIVDPKTGFGLTDHSLVTVIAKDCITANTLATAISVMGPDAGIKRVERTAGAAAHLVRKPGDEIEKRESKRLGKFLDPEHDVDLEKAVQPRMDSDEHR